MKTIVALVDLTDVAFKILNYAHTLASALGSNVVLLHVIPPMPVTVPLPMGNDTLQIMEIPSAETADAGKAKLEEHLNWLTKRGVQTSALQFEGPVAGTLIEQCQRVNADLVIMGSHHHDAFYNLLVGSVTADVLKQAPFPVLVVPVNVAEQKDA